MTKKYIGIEALLVILGITIGIVIGIVISKRDIKVTSVREAEAVTYQQQVEAPVGTPETTNPSQNTFEVKTAQKLHRGLTTRSEHYVVKHDLNLTVLPPTHFTKVVHSARHPDHLNHFDVYKQFDHATVLHAARLLNHAKPLNWSNRFEPHAGS